MIEIKRIIKQRKLKNGRHERMHQTLKYEAANPPELNLEEQAMKFKDFRYYYNHIRPHEAIG